MLILFLKNVRIMPDGFYRITEAGSVYLIPPLLINDLNNYIVADRSKLVAHWFRQLPDQEKEQVTVTSIYL